MQSCVVGTKVLYRLTLISGMLECLCFAGVVFGYASLVFVLKEDGYFSELCSSDTGSNSTLIETGKLTAGVPLRSLLICRTFNKPQINLQLKREKEAVLK